tara:strand:+ start:2314 stop:2511 length:198 start_codon:yes stop_codon:yes gene_type:complete
MQKIINAMSVASFVMSLMVVTGGGYLFVKRVEFTNHILSTLQDQMIDVIQNQIKLPGKTGPALPF